MKVETTKTKIARFITPPHYRKTGLSIADMILKYPSKTAQILGLAEMPRLLKLTVPNSADRVDNEASRQKRHELSDKETKNE